MNKKSKKGFTILELLAAVVIVGIILSLAVVAINKYILHGHDTVNEQLGKQLILSAKSYYSDNKNNFKNVDTNGVVIWYTTLKANDYITNDLVDSDGNSCSKSYVVYKDNKYTSCIVCDNDGYKDTDKVLCTESLDNNIKCVWKDNGNIKLGVKDGTNTATLELSCTGKNMKFANGGSTFNTDMFRVVNGKVGNIVYNSGIGSDGNVNSLTAKVDYIATDGSTGKGSITFKGALYVSKNNGEMINNEEITYDNISIDSAGPVCTLTGPYKSDLKTQVKSVKNGSTVYYGINCSDNGGIYDINSMTSDTIKNGFESSNAVSNLSVISLNKSTDKKTIDATVSVTVTNPNINASKKVFDLRLAFKKDVIFDNFKNGNDRVPSQIDGEASVLSIDDQGPTCVFNGPGSNALFDIKKSKLDVTNDEDNEYVFYELRCTDENGINPNTFKFSDIKSTEFGKIEQSGDMLAIKNNDNIVIGYRYLIKAYEKNISSLDKTIEAYLTYDERNVVDSTGNNGSNSKESLHVKMIDGKKIPTCTISVSYSNGYAVLTGSMESQSGLKGYGWSTDYGDLSDPDDYISISGTSKSVSTSVYSNVVYYLHMIDENDLTGYCKTEKYIYIPSPDTPYLNASDSISSGSWHNKNFTLIASGSGSNVTYYYGSNNNSMSIGGSDVSTETSGTTYYAKACWSSNSNICSSSAEYLVKLDKTPPVCEYSTKKLNGDSYTPGYWTQYNVEVKFTNKSDSLSGLDDSNTYIQGYTQTWPSVYQTTVGSNSSRNHTTVVKCTDNAGNVTSNDVSIKIDTTPPKVTWDVDDGATLYVGDKVTATCKDSDSGVISISGGLWINDKGPYGNSDLSTGEAWVTFESDGTKKLYLACNDKVGNNSYDDYSYSTPQITVKVEQRYWTKTITTTEYSWESSGNGYCKKGVQCCESSEDRVCNKDNKGIKKFKGCNSYESCNSYSTVYKYSKSYECLKKDGKSEYFFSKNSSGSGTCTSSSNCCTALKCNKSNHNKIKYEGCTSSEVCDSYTTSYTYDTSYTCEANVTKTTTKNQTSCTAGTKETKDSNNKVIKVVETTCTEEK